MLSEKSKKHTVKSYHKTVSGSKLDRATSIRAASKEIQSFIIKYKLAESAIGVTPNEFLQPILNDCKVCTAFFAV
jgi:hypothetical protein